MNKLRVAILGLVASAVLLATALPAMSARNSHAVSSINVSAGDIRFKLSSKTAASGVVTFKVKNVGALKHDFWIDGRKTKLLSHGQSNTLRLTLKKGNHPFKCTVAGHAAAGMKGVLKVT